MRDPIVISNLLKKEDYDGLRNALSDYKSFEFQRGFSRYIASDTQIPILNDVAKRLTGVARAAFKSQTLLPTYTLFAHYEGFNPPPSLYKHKDDNACTYTLDLCLYQNETWDLWVEDKPYTLNENQALAYYGNDQMHWREDFPNPGNQQVAMIFFHFAEPDHWWFTKGPSYLSVIRGQISDTDWNMLNSLNQSSVGNV